MIIEEFFEKVLNISDPVISRQIAALAEIRSLPKGQILIREGDAQTYLFFLLSGILRGFLIDISGQEITDCFGYRCGTPAIGTLEINTPSPITIEALTDCQLIRLPIAEALHFLDQDPRLLRIYNHLLCTALRSHWELKVMLHKRTAMERYQWFLSAYPGLIDQVTHRHVASFLGISPVTLSRLRSWTGEKGSTSPSKGSDRQGSPIRQEL